MSDHLLPFNIVCFGDSLTLGYLSPTRHLPFPEGIPYGSYLQEWIGNRGQVLVRGVCGETTQDMRRRFHADVLEPLPQVAIFLGGTNDLGLGISSSEILGNLDFFYEHAQRHGILPVAVTVPSIREDVEQNDHSTDGSSNGVISPAIKRAIAQRVTLNQAITKLGSQRHFPVVDWFTETCEPETQALAIAYSNDGLHLATTGYRRLAEMIWEQVLADLLKKQID